MHLSWPVIHADGEPISLKQGVAWCKFVLPYWTQFNLFTASAFAFSLRPCLLCQSVQSAIPRSLDSVHSRYIHVYRYFEPSIHDETSWMLGSKYLYTIFIIIHQQYFKFS